MAPTGPLAPIVWRKRPQCGFPLRVAVSKTVNGALLRVILRYCESVGADGASLAAAIGLDRAQLDDPDRRFPARKARDLWRAARQATGDPGLALHVAAQINPAMFGLVGHLALISRNVGEALGHLQRYQRLLAEDSFWTVRHTRAALTIEYDMDVPPDDDVWRHGVELSLAHAFGALLFLTGSPVRPKLAQFTFADPGYREVYESVFGCPLRFSAASNRLVFPADVAGLPIRSSLPGMADVVQQQAERALHELDAGCGTAAAVGRILTMLLPSGQATLAEVARRLNVSERTLTRRLSEEGISFRELLAQYSFELARAYFEQGEAGVEEVAFRLGYADLTGFHRAFRKRAGCSPGEYRRRCRAQ